MNILAKYDVFGWVVLHRQLPAGETLMFHLKFAEQARSWNTVYTKGRATLPPYPDRVPGMSSKQSTITDAGEFPMTAVEDTEWFCLDAKANGGALPSQVDPVVIERGETATFPQESRLFIGAGAFTAAGREFAGPKVLLAGTGPLQITAITPVYGYNLGAHD